MAVTVVPFEIVEQGVAYVGGTRVTLDTVIYTFLEGATAEEIVQKYPSLQLADVYAVVAYYLQNRDEIEAYLNRSADRARETQAKIESRFSPVGIRDRLLA